ncbi:MAG: helix-turn-helix domain-containing protein [Cyclobacteriaceae bacterium]
MQLVLEQLIYFAFFQSLFLIMIYAFSDKIRKAVNPYLIVLVAVMMIGLLGKIWIISFDGIQRLYSLSEYSVFLFGATVYLLTKSSLSENGRLHRNDLKHYIPGLIYAVVVSYYYVFAPREVISERFLSGELFWIVVVFMGTGLFVNTVYWLKSMQVFLSSKKRLESETSFTVKVGFFQNFLIAIGLCLLCWFAVYIIGIVGQSWLEREVRPFIWIAIAFLMLFISYYSIKEPSLFKAARQLSSVKYTQSRLTDEELEQLKMRLEQLMEEQKPFLNRSLMKADLAKMLGVNNPDVARLLNEKIGMNFFEYVNYFRIQEFIALAKMGKAQQLTFFGIAQEAGFNSKTTFNKSFKKIMGTSPSKYFAQEVA